MVQPDMAAISDPRGGLPGIDTQKIYCPGGPIVLTERSTLRWAVDEAFCGYKTPSTEMFNEFVSLYTSVHVHALPFARKWGPLRIGMDGKFNPLSLSGEEPIEAWRFFSQRAACVLYITECLKPVPLRHIEELDYGDEPALREEWTETPLPEYWGALSDPEALVNRRTNKQFFGMPNHALRRPIIHPDDSITWGAPVNPRSIIASELTAWMKRFPIRLGLMWRAKEWRLETFHDGSILNAITLQLLRAVVGADNLYRCSGCRLPYVRARRKPNPGQANYCRRCDKGEKAIQEADRRRRANMAAARRLHASGVSAADIATQLGVRKVATVHRWLTR